MCMHCAKKNIIHQVTTMLLTSKISYFQVITICQPPVLMNLHLIIARVPESYQYQLAGGYELEIGHF